MAPSKFVSLSPFRIEGNNIDLEVLGHVNGELSSASLTGFVNSKELQLNVLVNSKGGAVDVHANYAGESKTITLSSLKSTTSIHLTTYKDNIKPEVFVLSIPRLIKTRSLKHSVEGRDSADLIAIVGEQDYETTELQYGAAFSKNAAYKEFLEKMNSADSNVPGVAGWCIPLYCVPIIGIAAYLIKKCR